MIVLIMSLCLDDQDEVHPDFQLYLEDFKVLGEELFKLYDKTL